MAATESQIGVRVRNVGTGETVEVKIEPHGTVSMLKQRVAWMMKCHEKQQILKTPELGELDNIKKLEELGIVDGSEVELTVPEKPKEEAVVVSDDEGLAPAEAEEAPALPEALVEKELGDKEADEQADLKSKAADALEDGDLAKALELQTKALLIGPTAMMLAKRAELLLKLKRPKAAAADASAALQMNPDSCKAHRVRGRALRLLGDYEGALKSLSQAQSIDHDDAIEDILRYVSDRLKKLRKASQQAAAGEA